MRCFSLKILNTGSLDSEIKLPALSSTLKQYDFGMKNPSGLGVKFNVQYYNDPISSTIPNTIELFNAESELYINAETYIGKKIIFSAGFDESILAHKCGYTHIAMNTLLQGVITNIVPNYSSLTEPSVIISLRGDFATPVDKFKTYPFKGPTLILDGPTLNIYKITEWLKNFIPSGYVIAPDPSTYAALTLIESSIKLDATSYSQAVDKLEVLGIFCTQLDNTISISYVNPDTGTLQSNSILGGNSFSNGLASLGSVIASSFESLPTIEAEEMITQPQIISVVETQVTTMLRGDVKLGDIIKLSGKIKPSISNISFSNINSLQDSNNLPVFTGGKFKVTGINHIGDSRSPSPDAWATSLKLTRGF